MALFILAVRSGKEDCENGGVCKECERELNEEVEGLNLILECVEEHCEECKKTRTFV